MEACPSTVWNTWNNNVTGVFKPALMLMFTVEKNVVGYESSDYDKRSDYDKAGATTTASGLLDFFSSAPLAPKRRTKTHKDTDNFFVTVGDIR
jgi:hypothetical protein